MKKEESTTNEKSTTNEVAIEALKGELQTIETPGGRVLTFLTGPAPAEILPQTIKLSGDIKTVGNFLSIRQETGSGLQVIDKSRAVVLVDKENLTIELKLDPESVYCTSVKGELIPAPELEQFCINKNKTFSKEELVKLLKFNKLFFADAGRHAEMVSAFMKVSSTVNIRANDSSDERGNKAREFVKDVETNAPTEFVLNIPIFKGFHQEAFRVDVCLDVTEGSVRFWFQSVELHELQQVRRDQIFELELIAAKGFVIVNK